MTVRIPPGRVPFGLLEAEPGSQARGRYDFGYRDAPDEMRIKRPDNFVRIFRLIGDRHFVHQAPRPSRPRERIPAWRATRRISGRSRVSTNWSRISRRQQAKRQSGGSAPNTRSSPSMSTATRRFPMAASAASAPFSKACSASSAGIRSSTRPDHRARRADRPGRDLAGAGRPVRAFRRAAGDDPPDLPRGQRASGAVARDRRTAGNPLPGPRRQPEMDARRDAENAEIALRDHDPLHAEGRHKGPRHDVPHLHDPGESRLRERGGHAPQDAGVAEAAAACDRAVRQFAFHRRPAERTANPGAATSGATRTTSAPACCTSASRRISALPTMSNGRSTCRCISSSATADYHDMTHVTFRQFMAGDAKRFRAGRACHHRRLGEPSVDAVSRRPAEALPRNARRRWRPVAADLRAAGLLGRAAL